MLEKLANLPWYWVLVITAALLGVRYALRNSRSGVGKQVAEASESLAVAFAMVFLIIRPFVVQAFFIPSGSMRMGLLENDHILVNNFLYRIIREPERGDVIVFRAPPNASMDGKEYDFIKRIIGEPGDTVEVKAGCVQVGDIRLTHNDLRGLLADYVPNDAYGIRAKIVNDGVLMSGRKVAAREIAAAIDRPAAKVSFHAGVVLVNGKPLKESYTAEDPEEPFQKTRVPEGHYFMMGDNRNMSRDSRVWGPLERWRIKGKPMFIFYPFNRIGRVE